MCSRQGKLWSRSLGCCFCCCCFCCWCCCRAFVITIRFWKQYYIYYNTILKRIAQKSFWSHFMNNNLCKILRIQRPFHGYATVWQKWYTFLFKGVFKIIYTHRCPMCVCVCECITVFHSTASFNFDVPFIVTHLLQPFLLVFVVAFLILNVIYLLQHSIELN